MYQLSQYSPKTNTNISIAAQLSFFAKHSVLFRFRCASTNKKHQKGHEQKCVHPMVALTRWLGPLTPDRCFNGVLLERSLYEFLKIHGFQFLLGIWSICWEELYNKYNPFGLRKSPLLLWDHYTSRDTYGVRGIFYINQNSGDGYAP